MKRVSFAVLAVAAALYGCATESQDSSTSAGTPSPSGSPSASTSTGSPSGSQVGTRSATTSGSGTPASGMQPDMKRSVYYEFDKYDVKPEYRALVESRALAQGQPAGEARDRRQRRRARQPRVQRGAWAAPRRVGHQDAGHAGREAGANRGGKLGRGKAAFGRPRRKHRGLRIAAPISPRGSNDPGKKIGARPRPGPDFCG